MSEHSYYGRKPETIKTDLSEMVLDDYIRKIIFKNLDKFKKEFSTHLELKEFKKSIREDLQKIELKIKEVSFLLEKEKFLSKAREIKLK